MIVETFRPEHLRQLVAQGVQRSQLRQVSHVPDSYVSVIAGPALTARDGTRIVACGGVLPMGPAMGLLWGLLAEEATHHMLWLHRATKRFIEIAPPRRLEATVEEGFQAGCKWLLMLGFKFEGKREAYGLNGETHLAYARITR